MATIIIVQIYVRISQNAFVSEHKISPTHAIEVRYKYSMQQLHAELAS